MSLNLRFGPRPRHRGRRVLILLCLTGIVGLVAWQQNWQPPRPVAVWAGVALSYLPLKFSTPKPVAGTLAQDTVVLVKATVVDSPQSEAYTADLYTATDRDDIPWPNIAGRTSIEFYTVEPGDTLWSIAKQFQLDFETLRWSNPELERNPDILVAGSKLRIMPVPGIYHLLEPGDTIESLAERYGVAPEDITDYPPNALFPPYTLAGREGLIVPYGRKETRLPRPALSLEFALAWPIVGTVTATFEATHPAIDIAAPYGSPVYAAADGTVLYAGRRDDDSGYTVIVDHGDDRETWYNGLKRSLVEAGSFVTRGVPIGEIGSAGHTAGPHLHFELHQDGRLIDPLVGLPGTPQ